MFLGEGALSFESASGGEDPVGGEDCGGPGRRGGPRGGAERLPVRRGRHGAGGGSCSALLRNGVASVVAMAYRVYPVAAAEFMAAFYERLFVGGTWESAVTAGRQQLYRSPRRPSPKGELPLADWLVPSTYLRREVSFPQAVLPRPAGSPSLSAALAETTVAEVGAEAGGWMRTAASSSAGMRGFTTWRRRHGCRRSSSYPDRAGRARQSWRRRSAGGGATPVELTSRTACSGTRSSPVRRCRAWRA